MPASFTEYVKLITDASQTLATIAKVNEALNKLREQAEKPILIKMSMDENKINAAEKKIREERQKTADADAKNIKQRIADNKAIKAMNAEQGGNPGNVPYGSTKSLEQGRKFNEQLEETTARINKLADAHKHIKQVSQAANVEVSPKLTEALATQTVNKYDASKKKEELDRIASVRQRDAQEEEGAKRVLAIEAERIRQIRERNSQEEEGEKRLLAIEAERVAKVRERQTQEEEGERRLLAIEAERVRQVRERGGQEEEGEKRLLAIEAERVAKVRQKQAQEEEGEKRLLAIEAERIAKVRQKQTQEEEGIRRIISMQKEQDRISATAERERIKQVRLRQSQEEEGSRRIWQMERQAESDRLSLSKTGLKGWLAEGYRDARRNVMYGGIQRVEEAGNIAGKSETSRSQEIEALYQSGRTDSETKQILSVAQTMADKYAVLSQTEGMTLQRHAIGEVGTVKGGEDLAQLAASFVALRTAAVGAEGALSENQKVMKAFNDLGWVNNPELMKKAYDQLAKLSQIEGANYDVGSFLTTDRMFKSAKFEMSPEAILKIAPLLSIGEGAGRAGNEFAMLLKSLTYSGKSISKEAHAVIDGTALSDGKGGYNPQLAKDIASGTVEGIKDFNKILDSAARKNGVNPDDAVAFTQWTKKAIGNSSANELAIWMHDQVSLIEKQLASYNTARGTSAAEGIGQRDIDTALQQVEAKFQDASVAMLDPFKEQILETINLATKAEQWASKNPGKTGMITGVAIAGGMEALHLILDNPSQSANTAALVANTLAVNANTGSRALSSLPGGPSGMAITGIAVGAIAAAYDVKLAIDDWKQYKTNKELEQIFTDKKTNKEFNEKRQADADQEVKDNTPYIGHDDPPDRQAYERSKQKAQWIKDNPIELNPLMASANLIDPNNLQNAINNSDLHYYDKRDRTTFGGNSEKLLTETNEPTIKTSDHSYHPIIAPTNHDEMKPFSANDLWSKMKDVASDAESAIGNMGSKISGAGSGVVSALEGIASEIMGIKIPNPSVSANVGTNPRGPR